MIRAVACLLSLALAECGNVEPPIKAEAQADGGCWEPQECPAGAADLSGGTAPGDLCGSSDQPEKIGSATCIVHHSSGLTCWQTAGSVSFFFVSSCAECETLIRCQ